jgi:dTDP-4-amino-4,6-dideoxygalactose transaminase
LPPRPMTGRHAWHLYAVRVRPSYGVGRVDLNAALSERGIGTSVHFIPIHRLTWYSRVCLQAPGGFPGAEGVFDQTLSLPMDHVMTDEDVVTVCTALAEIGESR